jgi:hypothetical protein
MRVQETTVVFENPLVRFASSRQGFVPATPLRFPLGL